MLLHLYRHNRPGLLVYLASHLMKALQDLPDEHPALLTGRFIYWVPRRPAP